MSKLAQLAFLLFVATVMNGCATMSSSPGSYSVSGVTASPIEATAVAGRVYTEQYNAETYRRAVESGRAFPYPGGMGGDYWLYYRGFVPTAPVVAPPPATTSTAAPTSSASPPPTGDALAEAREARRRADAALRMHARLRDRMAAEEEAADGGAP
ncbi:MAG: hypothetical protein RL272_571 [Candidatus Parcubacteria bacterium]